MVILADVKVNAKQEEVMDQCCALTRSVEIHYDSGETPILTQVYFPHQANVSESFLISRCYKVGNHLCIIVAVYKMISIFFSVTFAAHSF